MSKLIRSFLVFILFLFPIVLKGQNSYSDKAVNLPSGQITLKAAFKILSDQTGCVFSYDPTIIIDKQELNLSIQPKLSLKAALLKILPKSIHFKFNGKYVVIQKACFTNSSTNKTHLKIQQHNRINENERHGNRIPYKVKQVFEVIINEHNDSISQNTKAISTNPISENRVKTDYNQSLINLSDTSKLIKPKPKPIFEIELAGEVEPKNTQNTLYKVLKSTFDIKLLTL